jgi:hypothetical protein
VTPNIMGLSYVLSLMGLSPHKTDSY